MSRVGLSRHARPGFRSSRVMVHKHPVAAYAPPTPVESQTPAQAQAAGPYTPCQGCMKTGRLHPSDTRTCPQGSAPWKGVYGAGAGFRTPKQQSRQTPPPQIPSLDLRAQPLRNPGRGFTIRSWIFFAYSRSRLPITCPTYRRATSAGACTGIRFASRFTSPARSERKVAG